MNPKELYNINLNQFDVIKINENDLSNYIVIKYSNLHIECKFNIFNMFTNDIFIILGI